MISSFKKIGVIGLGYIGLPLALLFANKGFGVIGIDVDERKVNSLKQNTSYIPETVEFLSFHRSDESLRKTIAWYQAEWEKGQV
ncbi:NAD(P)-binding domain-containing protein [Bacillus sp. ISL-7]|uniref:NAD(P)-binding domain-containing protein n=1 Tax=Bacillus sp. ISL-7 TaxID=2819136 RepID=UPI001BE54513|nr:NAD(P)-binding domain-containing protein [Bacillus sp. ISL-7]MBT2734504.1 hypothetical protein [Bacillus sp. ISL-7]